MAISNGNPTAVEMLLRLSLIGLGGCIGIAFYIDGIKPGKPIEKDSLSPK